MATFLPNSHSFDFIDFFNICCGQWHSSEHGKAAAFSIGARVERPSRQMTVDQIADARPTANSRCLTIRILETTRVFTDLSDSLG